MNRAPLLRLLVGFIAVALVSACSGPSTKINASMREFPQNVRIGDATSNADSIAPIPPTAPQLDRGITFLPKPTRAANPVEAAVCAPAKLGATAALPVGVQPPKPPAPGLYKFRTTGKHTVGGASTSVVDYPTLGRRLVGAARASALPGGVTQYDFEVIVELGENRTSTLYRLIPKSADDPTPQQNPLPGLYVVAVATLDATYKPVSQFTPQPPMKVIPFPAFEGQTFYVASADPLSGVAVTYRGAVGDNTSVDACGQIIDARRVKHTGSVTIGCGSGPCRGSAKALTTTFSAVYDLALQYGGIAVQDHVTVAGGPLDATYSDDLSGVINALPKQP